jgi:SAM-dependent methyltransferase
VNASSPGGASFDEDYYRSTYGTDLTRRLPHLTREHHWARWLRRRLGNGTVIDLGSGLGWLALNARDQGLRSVCVDLSAFSAHHLRHTHGLAALVGSATRLPLRRASVGGVVALDVLEHIASPRDALVEIRAVLEPGGLVVISVPNTEGLGARRKRAEGTWFADRDHTHTSLWSPDEWTRALTDAGFSVERRGSDFLWDVPYPSRVPARVQRAALLPLHRLTSRLMGALPWSAGENLVLVGRAT